MFQGETQPFKSGSDTRIRCVDEVQRRSFGFAAVHILARALAVVIVDFLVMQKTNTGFLCEYLMIISGSLALLLAFSGA